MFRRQPTVYLHIGPPKTGTTYLQDVLWRNPRRLSELAVTFPRRPIDHFRAALDLRGLDFGGHKDPRTDGAWDKFSAAALSCGTDKVVVSHEALAGATSEQISRAIASLSPAEVHVVYGARDLARQLPAVWQESLKNRRTRSYPQFLERSLRQPRRRRRGTGFWTAQDLLTVLARWAEHVPPDRVHVMTLPPRSAAGDTLWRRFCAALAIDPLGFDLDVARSNTSLTPAESEVLRRLNVALPRELPWPEYERLVKHRFNTMADRGVVGQRLRIPPEYRRQVCALTERTQAGLAASAYEIVGDLDDLTSSDDAFGPVRGMTSAKVCDSAVDLLAEVLTESSSAAAERRRRLHGAWLRVRRRGADR